MRTTFRSLAVTLALAAMLLRALLPVGWMPSSATQAPLMICPMMGGMMQAAPVHRGLPQHHDRFCPFTASLAQLAMASLPPISKLPVSPVAGGKIRTHPSVVALALYRPQSPRAPPFFA